MTSSDRGFTLIETLVALAILGLALTTSYNLVRNATQTIERTERSQRLVDAADAAWHLMALLKVRDPGNLGVDWPDDIEFDVTVVAREDRMIAGAPIPDQVDWVILNVALGSQTYALEGVMPAVTIEP